MRVNVFCNINKKLSPAICIAGPTASGKTGLALELCQHLPCDIISVDSVLVYRGMDIGTAKPDASVLKTVKHYLINIRSPADSYSVSSFCEDALEAMAEITARGRIPLLVGGTMLYFKKLINGMADLPAVDDSVRQEIYEQAKQYGWEWVHKQLEIVDPISAKRIHKNDSQRLSRALEVYRISGNTITSHWERQKMTKCVRFPYKLISLAVAPTQRVVLHERIEERFNLMINNGFLDEVLGLYNREDLNPYLPAMRSVGYRQVWQYFSGELNHENMVKCSVVSTKQLAKRQFTWLRSWSELTWLDSLSEGLVDKALEIIHEKLPL